ncbi:Rv1733c family protein [Streptomyces minutiscleroticus]|uniref:Rv1733c family protein n=1 Tax=Streptomyces minutiscleroticus TaxID=68238 RepID=UPI003328DAC6
MVEAWTVLCVVLLLVFGAPLAGLAAGWWAHDAARATAERQRAERERVRVEVAENAPAALPTTQHGRQAAYPVRVRWTDGDGVRHTGETPVAAGTRRGDTTAVWLDAAGRITAPPVTGTAVLHRTLSAGVCTAAGFASAVVVAYTVVRRAAGRRRLQEWERAWARTGPEWRRLTP